jgi:hypothetical protein
MEYTTFIERRDAVKKCGTMGYRILSRGSKERPFTETEDGFVLHYNPAGLYGSLQRVPRAV